MIVTIYNQQYSRHNTTSILINTISVGSTGAICPSAPKGRSQALYLTRKHARVAHAGLISIFQHFSTFFNIFQHFSTFFSITAAFYGRLKKGEKLFVDENNLDL
jgi:hypothetical protein